VLVFCHDLVMKAFRIVLERQDVAGAIQTVRSLGIKNCDFHAYGGGDGLELRPGEH
jgi:hypothetical protein